MKIVPAILTQSSAELCQMLSQSATFTTFVQLDIMDGEFVPSKSVSADDLTQLTTGLDIEVHLMVSRPETYFAHFQAAGAKRVLFHYESTADPQSLISLARQLGLKVGIALNPDTPASAVEPFLTAIDCVLFLSVNPGFYGSAFIPEVADRLWQFKRQHPEVEVGLDGGIKGWNLRRLRSFGVDYACVGSAVFKAADPGKAYRDLSRLLYRPRTPAFRPASADEGLLGQLVGYLRHQPGEPQWEEDDRLIVSPVFEPALAAALRAFGYSTRTRPPWAEVLAERQLDHARDLGTRLKAKGSDALVYCLVSPEALSESGAAGLARSIPSLGLSNIRVILRDGRLPAAWPGANWSIIQTSVPRLSQALDAAQRSWDTCAIILLSYGSGPPAPWPLLQSPPNMLK